MSEFKIFLSQQLMLSPLIPWLNQLCAGKCFTPHSIKKALMCNIFSFHGADIPTTADFRLPTGHY